MADCSSAWAANKKHRNLWNAEKASHNRTKNTLSSEQSAHSATRNILTAERATHTQQIAELEAEITRLSNVVNGVFVPEKVEGDFTIQTNALNNHEEISGNFGFIDGHINCRLPDFSEPVPTELVLKIANGSALTQEEFEANDELEFLTQEEAADYLTKLASKRYRYFVKK